MTIARYSDGHCLGFEPRAAKDFRDCLTTHSPERVIETYLKIAKGANFKWQPLYKPERMPR